MCSLLDNLAVVDDDNIVCIFDRGKAMCDDETRAPFAQGNSIESVQLIGNVFDAAGLESGVEYGVDRILDMCRTTLNVVGDITAATYVARSEGYDLLKNARQTDLA